MRILIKKKIISIKNKDASWKMKWTSNKYKINDKDTNWRVSEPSKKGMLPIDTQKNQPWFQMKSETYAKHNIYKSIGNSNHNPQYIVHIRVFKNKAYQMKNDAKWGISNEKY